MRLVLPFIPLIIVFLIFASCYKLSAYLFRRRVVSWKDCFIFAFLVVMISTFATVIINFLSISLPLSVSIALTVIIQMALGAWFFRDRSQYANGGELGWRGGAELTMLSIVLIGVIGFVLMIGGQYLQTITTH